MISSSLVKDLQINAYVTGQNILPSNNDLKGPGENVESA